MIVNLKQVFYSINHKLTVDFTTIPDILLSASKDDTEIPRDLQSFGRLLDIAYRLLEHPILRNWKGFPKQDPFMDAMENPDYYKVFSRTLVERTIHQAEFYSKVHLPNGILTIRGKGIELAINLMRDFLETANTILAIKDDEIHLTRSDIHFFRLTRTGELCATIKEFQHTCEELIILIQKHSIEAKLNEKIPDAEKVTYLLRQKADLLKRRDQMSEKAFDKIIETINIELDYHKELNDNQNVDPLILDIARKFFSENQARISNQKLLRNLINSQWGEFAKGLSELVLQLFSFHDIGGKEPEKFYHVFLLGVLNSFSEEYKPVSNKEAGLGRFDIVLIPNNSKQRGVIFEIKQISSLNPDVIEDELNKALNQVITNKYSIELKLNGLYSAVVFAIVFRGKELFTKFKEIEIT